ncbi:hypothetical protein C2S52_007170 [Perilla frutescens var. hirtella]|nr:hypothetical protein C2S51_008694 [Perilla frutescens var. frutescens]KAH6787618.1 hypothetical protein C2S52_007170 [Perilla frutescens var. hirtella]
MEDSELIWSNLDRLDHSWPVDEETLAHQRNTASAKNKLKTTKTKSRSKIDNENVAILEQSAEEGPSGLKKLDHNAKERIRRMKLNASFLALRALLPDSRRSKSVEDEAICIRSASALDISETRICYHLHIQGKNQMRTLPPGGN